MASGQGADREPRRAWYAARPRPQRRCGYAPFWARSISGEPPRNRQSRAKKPRHRGPMPGFPSRGEQRKEPNSILIRGLSASSVSSLRTFSTFSTESFKPSLCASGWRLRRGCVARPRWRSTIGLTRGIRFKGPVIRRLKQNEAAMDLRARADNEHMDRVNPRPVEGSLVRQRSRAALIPGSEGFRIKGA